MAVNQGVGEASGPECCDYLWKHYVIGLDYSERAEEHQMSYDSVLMKIALCLSEAKALVA
jgi:hypothetical protein